MGCNSKKYTYHCLIYWCYKGNFKCIWPLNLFTFNCFISLKTSSSVTGSKNTEAEHLCFKKTSKGIVMGWYFFSQIWFYFYKIVIEIFDHQMWISDCLFILFEMMCVLHSLLICWCSPDINFSFIKFTFEITILCWLFNFVKSISIFLVHLIHNKRILNIHLKTLKRNCSCCFL